MKYALPTILSNIFMNIYGLVDSLFVSNLIGTNALSAVNIVGPFLAIALAIGTNGCDRRQCFSCLLNLEKATEIKARQNFSFFILFSIAISATFSVVGIVLKEPLLYAMGADQNLYALCEAYAIPIMLIIPFAMVGILLQIFFVAAGNPGLGFGLSLAGGVLNIILDYVLIAVIPLGVAGAAWATGAGYVLQTVVGICYFTFRRKGSLYFVKPKFDGKALWKACSKGMSEMVGMAGCYRITMIAMNGVLMI